jgi:hypothetical protein
MADKAAGDMVEVVIKDCEGSDELILLSLSHEGRYGWGSTEDMVFRVIVVAMVGERELLSDITVEAFDGV